MDSIFKITKNGTCGILVDGLELDNSEYILPTGIWISTRNYTYLHSNTLNVLYSMKFDGTETMEAYKVVDHVTNPIDRSEFTFRVDGLYEISHLIIPNRDWLNYVLENNASALTAYSLIYFIENGLFYKYTAGVITEVTLTEIMSVNPNTTTIIRCDKSTFCTCYISECFNKLCASIFESISLRCSNKTAEKDLIRDRDILWMAINVIKYQLETNQLYEAQRILEDVNKCNYFCDSVTLNSNSYGCGCNS